MSVLDVWHWSLISWEQVMSLWVVIADGLDSQKPALSANIFYKSSLATNGLMNLNLKSIFLIKSISCFLLKVLHILFHEVIANGSFGTLLNCSFFKWYSSCFFHAKPTGWHFIFGSYVALERQKRDSNCLGESVMVLQDCFTPATPH